MVENNKKKVISKKKEVVLGKILTIEQFLKKYAKDINQKNLDDAFSLKFNLDKKRSNLKIPTFIRRASIEDSETIANLFKEIYKGTYPYKHLEDKEYISNMINSGKSEWLLFETKEKKITGCFGADIDFTLKKGSLYGFIVLKQYRDIVDSLKAFMGSIIYLWKKYYKEIPIWFGEVRTVDTAPLYGPSSCGMKPIAFFPNKDIFFNRVESEFLIVAFLSLEFLRKCRNKNIPTFIWPVLGAYAYSNRRYKLGEFEVENPQLNLNNTLVKRLENSIKIDEISDKYNNKKVIFSQGDSYFKFSYNYYSKNLEKTEYKIESLEELKAFLNHLKKFINRNNINYFQCFVSAYESTHQQIFFETGFQPRGYIPCWRYNPKTKLFDDCIVFNCYTGNIAKNMKLIKECRTLLKLIGFYNELEKERLLKYIKEY
ncbi:MAG: hypothetical protein ACTSPW_16475 [Promethearchaeota archaeon]